jgi:hypothetical protein
MSDLFTESLARGSLSTWFMGYLFVGTRFACESEDASISGRIDRGEHVRVLFCPSTNHEGETLRCGHGHSGRRRNSRRTCNHIHLQPQWKLRGGQQQWAVARTIWTGYSFGPNTGLSLSNAVTDTGPYSIDIRFYFDSLTGVTNTGYQRILDFRNRLSDSGLYSYRGGSLQLFASSYAPGLPPAGPRLDDPSASSGSVFSPGTMADLLVTRDATGLFSAHVDGNLAFSVMDLSGATQFSGPNNIIWFFVDDLQSLYFYPNTPEAGSGFIDSIRITSDVAAVPEPSTLGLIGLGLLGLGAMKRRRQLRTLGTMQ